MKVPYNWLKDYVNINISPKELGDKLTLSGSKVEEIITNGDEIQKVVTGKLMQIEPHPDSEHLVICQLNIGAEQLLQIVTGADNMKEGDIVPVALHGSSLPGGKKIKKGKLRGVMSNGMMCSAEELGISEENPVDGLMILPKDTPIGKDIKQVLGLDNAVIDFEITSNRPDCLSVIGIARETAATLNTSYSMPETSFNADSDNDVNDFVKVSVEDDLCTRYMAVGVNNIKIAPSPEWMQERLKQAGVRPINNIVDVTNFVMLETGEPMHAFDVRQITSGKIVVKRAEDGEKFTTLDEVERTLDSDVLTIRDNERAIALAGIMGGLNSEVEDDTTSVIFELACFDSTNIRISSKKLGLRTEASSRFEKEMDPNLAEFAMKRACNLVQQINAGKVMKGVIDVYNKPVNPHSVSVDYKWINKFLGTSLTKEDMISYLERLEFNIESKDDTIIVNVPTFRCDINIKEDVAEEVARIYGYDNIPKTIFRGIGEKGGKNKKQHIDDIIIESLLSSGINQSISYSFVSPKCFDKINIPADSSLRNAVKIRNPLGEDFSIMRTTTIPSMMEALSRNYSKSNEEVRLFEIGKVYIPTDETQDLPEEKNILTLGMYGNMEYVDIKGVAENVFDCLGINSASYTRNSENVVYHPGKTADIYIKRTYIGTIGEVHPDVTENYGIDERCYVGEIDIDALRQYVTIERKYKSLPKFPAVTRDIAILIDDEILVQEIQDIILKQGGNMVEEVKLFDVYKGKQIPAGKKSIAYSIKYRLEDRTLTDKEVNKVHDKILRSLEYQLGAELR